MSRKMHIIPSLTMSLVLMTCVITKANDNSNNTNILINENVTATSHTDGVTTLTNIEATTNENTTTTLFSFHPDKFPHPVYVRWRNIPLVESDVFQTHAKPHLHNSARIHLLCPDSQ